ncbi:uncharacterized protein IUM83_17652 [Phytophthora cinnamomi]|uniref:uncharacterized protein n=1 Tax=Phytophthora cinnamomi TaxID=4785 RepID=UPI00355A7DC3|nr:hypothetical protein IUM83_17652 [Phytophthora cinnamomi]
MSAPQKKTSKSVGSHHSIDDYFERQKAKYGDVVDFDDDDEDMEGEEDSPSKRKDSVSSESLDPHAKNVRPREGDESDASSSKRSRTESNTPLASAGALSTPRAAAAARDVKAQGSSRAAGAARDPWMPSASEIADRFGNSVPPNEVPLYVCSAIKDDAVAAELHFDAETHQRRDYYIGLFHELRWFQSKKTSSRSKVPEWQALCQSWNAFVENFNKRPSAYRDRIKQARDRFETYSKRGKLEQLHVAAEEANVPCAVPEGFQCTKCFPGAVRLSDRDLNGYTSFRVPESLKELRAKFLAREGSGAGDDRSARSTSAVPVRTAPRTPSPFPERPPARRSAAPMYLDGEEILSNEYENEPLEGSFSGYYGQQSAQQSSGLSRGRHGSAVAGVGTRPGYDQPRADQYAPLHDRVTVVERLQGAEFAALKQELANQKAQVAAVSQTASNIQVELGTQMKGLLQRVRALEERLLVAEAKSSASASAPAEASGQPS